MRRREILCIDDDDQSLQVRKILLESFDFHVTTAMNGCDGLKLFRARDVDAVVVDYQMPDIDGGEVARAVKSLRPEVPVLMMSALPWLPKEAPRDCIDAFIIKGGPTSKLVSEIERMLGAAPQPAKEKMQATKMIGILSGVMVAKVRGLLAKPKPVRTEPKVARARVS